jgi:hypothetical protein
MPITTARAARRRSWRVSAALSRRFCAAPSRRVCAAPVPARLQGASPRLYSVSPLPISAAPRRDPAVAALSSHRNALPSCALVTIRAAECCATSRAAICLDGTAIARCPAMQNLRLLACVVAALGSMAIAGCGDDNDCDNNNHDSSCLCDSNDHDSNCVPPPPPPQAAVLRVENQCGFAITEIHVAAVGSTTWGPNLISAVLTPNASLTVPFTCGTFDVLVIDQAGQQCTLHDVDLCANNADWVIGNKTCEAFTNHDPAATGPASGAAH